MIARKFFMVMLWAIGSYLLSQGVYMDLKAELAQVFIANAWQQRSYGRPPPKPWRWADTRPIAKLSVRKIEKALYVMQDSSGESLAFGPGHIAGSADVSSDGHVFMAGHRDSHFDFLRELQVGDEIITESYLGKTARYRVVELLVVDTDKTQLSQQPKALLTLITCYPFDSVVPGGPLRYVVTAEKLS